MQTDMFSICRKSFRFPNLFLHFESGGRQHDFHQLIVVREMTVAVMFLGQLLGEKNTDFANC